MSSLLNDLRHGFRVLIKNPGFTVIALLTLALGIGANTAIYSLVHAEHQIPWRFEQPERLVFIWNPMGDYERGSISALDYLDWREQSTSFEEAGLYNTNGHVISGLGEPQRIRAVHAMANLMPMLGFQAQRGRLHGPEEDSEASSNVIVLSDRLWRSRYNAREDILGQTVLVDDQPYQVIGVMPPEAKFERIWWGVEAFMPLPLDTVELSREYRGYSAIARLEPGVSVEQAQAEMDTIAARLAEVYPETNEDRTAFVEPLLDRFLSIDDWIVELAIMFAVAMVLLIACINLANMLLAKATVRGREFAVRTALGAGRGRLIRQLFTESLILAVMGGALGIMLAAWAVDVVAASYPEMPLTPSELRFDSSVLVYTLVVALAAAIAFGLTPALSATRLSLNETLKEGAAAASSGRSRIRLRNSLVVGQLAISLPMFICCGLAMRHVQTLKTNATYGLDTERLLTMRLDLPHFSYEEEAQRASFVREMLERLNTTPGVDEASAITFIPIGSDNCYGGSVVIEEQLGEVLAGGPISYSPGYQVVSPNYFEMIRVPIRAGRDFTSLDEAESLPVAIVNERMARHCWPGESGDSIIGKRFTLDPEAIPVEWITVVGLVADSGCNIWGEPPGAMCYLPYSQKPVSGFSLLTRAMGEPMDAAPIVRGAIHELDAGVPIAEVKTVEAIIHRWLRDDRMLSNFLGGLAALALVLACIGLYGVMSYSVIQRTQEIGIRVALGADRRDILRLILNRCLKLTIVGLVIGLILALPIGFLLASFLYGVGGTDPFTLLGVPVLLLGVALAAGYIPARRATKLDPIEALRCQ